MIPRGLINFVNMYLAEGILLYLYNRSLPDSNTRESIHVPIKSSKFLPPLVHFEVTLTPKTMAPR